MSQPNRKRPHQQSPPRVKEEQQEHEEEGTTHLFAARINGNASQCSSSNLEDSNTIDTAAGGNGGDDINELKLKMAALEAKNQILEGKLAYQELRARQNAISEGNILANLKQENRALWMRLKEVEANAQEEKKEMMNEFGKRLTALEAKHQQENAGLKVNNERNQQRPNAKMPDRVVVNMLECQVTSNNSNEIQSVAPNLMPCHSAQEVVEAKRLCNPTKNCWNPGTGKATMKVTLPDQLNVHNRSPDKWGNIVALKGFPVSACHRQFQQKHFTGPILYYYEITTKSSPKHNERSRLCIGLSVGSVQKGTCLGRTSNTYAMQDDKCDYCLISGEARFLEWPLGAVKPKWTGTGCEDVFGCGLVLSADDKLAIFFTTNAILMGKQIAIDHAGSILFPTVCLNSDVSVEANFGQKPFKYNIDQCPGLKLQW